ncbi:MAG: hypothetical protein FWD36_04135 [Treponema sp.]|nr:hypothetical protein [Treponema sp.]
MYSVTEKLTANCAPKLLPLLLTLKVAEKEFIARPILGETVNVAVSEGAILASVSDETVKLVPPVNK